MTIHLLGPNADDLGVRFPALSDAYDLVLRRQAHRLWKELQCTSASSRSLHEGIYAFVSGPRYVSLEHLSGPLSHLSDL